MIVSRLEHGILNTHTLQWYIGEVTCHSYVENVDIKSNIHFIDQKLVFLGEKKSLNWTPQQ